MRTNFRFPLLFLCLVPFCFLGSNRGCVVDMDISGDWEGRVKITRGIWEPLVDPEDPDPEQPIDISLRMGFVDLALSLEQARSSTLSGYFGQTSGICTPYVDEEEPASCHFDGDCEAWQTCDKVKRAFLFSLDSDGDGEPEPLVLDTSGSYLNYIFLHIVTEPLILSSAEIPNPHPQGFGGEINIFGVDLTREISLDGIVVNDNEITGTYLESLETPAGSLIIEGDFSLNRYYAK